MQVLRNSGLQARKGLDETMNTLENKIDSLIERLQRTPDIGLIQAGSEFRIVNRSTGEILERCYTESAARLVLEQYREKGQ
jgi:hypothetical protein